jgi:hypothetical protein
MTELPDLEVFSKNLSKALSGAMPQAVKLWPGAKNIRLPANIKFWKHSPGENIQERQRTAACLHNPALPLYSIQPRQEEKRIIPMNKNCISDEERSGSYRYFRLGI